MTINTKSVATIQITISLTSVRLNMTSSLRSRGKEINKIIQSEDKDEKSKSVKCICINYGDFLADCEGFVQKRYHDFKCNPKHQFEKKADTILENAIHEKNFMPDLFLIRLNRKQSACNSQIDFVFELLDKSFLETDPIRKSEISEETLNLCLSADVSFIMVYIGMNR